MSINLTTTMGGGAIASAIPSSIASPTSPGVDIPESSSSGISPGGATVLGSAISMLGGLIGGALQYKRQKKLMKRQAEYNIQQWNREVDRQDYLLSNSARLQKESLQNAGLSTATLSGSFSPVSSAPSGSTGGAPSVSSANLLDSAPAFIQALNQQKATDSAVELNQALADKARSEAQRNLKDVEVYDQRFAAELALKSSEESLNYSRVDNTDFDTFMKKQNFPYELKILNNKVQWSAHGLALQLQEIANAELEGKLTEARIADYWASVKQRGAYISSLYQSVAESKALVKVYGSQVSLNAALENVYKADKLLKEAQVRWQKFENHAASFNVGFEYNGENISVPALAVKYYNAAQGVVTATQQGDAAAAKKWTDVLGDITSLLGTGAMIYFGTKGMRTPSTPPSGSASGVPGVQY